MRFTWPEGNLTRTNWTLGRKRRLVTFTTWVPIPPLFLDWPLRTIELPRMGLLPVITQTLDMISFSLSDSSEKPYFLASFIPFCKHQIEVFSIMTSFKPNFAIKTLEIHILLNIILINC